MFFGTNPSIVSQYIRQRIEELKPKTVFAPFAGNFVIEQLVADVSKEIFIHSTDIALYSRAIGFGATDQEFDATLKPEIAEWFPFMADKTSPLDKAAQVIFFGDVAKFFGKDSIPYYRAMVDDAVRNQEAYYKKIIGKLERFKERVGHMTFYGIDACELIKAVGAGDLVFYDPPVIMGDYEKGYEPLEACYTFEAPAYTELNSALKLRQLEELNEVGATVFWRTNNPLPADAVPDGYQQVYHAGYKYDAAYCLYSNWKEAKRFVARFNPLKEQVKHYPLIGKHDEITEDSKVELIRVPVPVGDHYRLMWVKKAQMLDTGNCYLVFIDRKMAGMIYLSADPTFGNTYALIASDPACPSSRYKRLSKLIMALLCTRTTLKMFNDEVLWEHTGFTTVVFTNANSSMKYRTLFKRVNKLVLLEGHYQFKLTYRNTEKLFDDYRAALQWFLKNDGKVLNTEQ